MISFIRTAKLDDLLEQSRQMLVTNARLQAEVVGKTEIINLQSSAIKQLGEDVARLQQTILDLRREGFNPAPSAGPMQSDPGAELPPFIYSAIRELAKPGSDLYHELVEEAARGVANEVNQETIVRNLRRGSKFNPLHA